MKITDEMIEAAGNTLHDAFGTHYPQSFCGYIAEKAIAAVAPLIVEAQAKEIAELRAANDRLRAMLGQWRTWYDRDGSAGGASLVFEETR